MNKNQSPDDDILWIKKYLKTKDTHYWGLLYEKYKKQVFFICYGIVKSHEDASDLAVEALIKAFENLHTFNQTRPFLPWVQQIATHLCIDTIRRKKRIRFEAIQEKIDLRSDENVEKNVHTKQLAGGIQQAIRRLPGPQRKCFCLFFIQQKSYKEIASYTGISLKSVRSHIQNGKRKFKLLMEEMNIAPGL